MYDVAIIGRGPAGLSASLYTARGGLKTVIVGRESFLAKSDMIENYCCSEPMSGKQLIEKGIWQAERFGVDFADEEVIDIKKGNGFEVVTSDNTHMAKAVIIATGKSRNKIDIEGIERFEGKGVHYCVTCDGFFYSDKKVGVLGFNDYAAHEVMEFEGISGNVTLYTNGEEPELDERTNKYLQDKGIKINAKGIKELDGNQALEKLVFDDGEAEDIDGLFVAYGSASSVDFARKLGILLDGDNIIVDENQSTNVKGVFAAGDCTGGIMQIATAVGQGAVAGQRAKAFVLDNQ
jgi:thioredoxin reductase (NADPH)